MEPIYSEQGKEKELVVVFKFSVNHNPGNRNHLRQLLSSVLDKFPTERGNNNPVWVEIK